jgi:hypothetical protein
MLGAVGLLRLRLRLLLQRSHIDVGDLRGFHLPVDHTLAVPGSALRVCGDSLGTLDGPCCCHTLLHPPKNDMIREHISREYTTRAS